MTWATDLAKEFKSRTNESKIGAVVGTVLQVDPFKIGILNNRVLLDENNSYFCSSVLETYRNAEVEIKPYTVNATASVSTPHGSGSISSISVDGKTDYDTVIKFKNILKLNDKVLVISSEDNQNFFIVDILV